MKGRKNNTVSLPALSIVKLAESDLISKSEQEIRSVERKILGSQSIKNHLHLLETLERAGADRNSVVRFLAYEVEPQRFLTPEIAAMRKRKAELKDLAQQMRIVIRRARRFTEDSPSSHRAAELVYRRILDPLMTGRLVNNPLPPRLSPWGLFVAMDAFANGADEEVQALGRLLKASAPGVNRLNETFLLFYVYAKTGKGFEKQLAQLLTDAYGAVGKAQKVSAEKLRKHLERHVKPLYARWWKLVQSSDGLYGQVDFRPSNA